MGRSGVTSVWRAPEEPDVGMMHEMTIVDSPAVAIEGVSHCYGRRQALDDVTFSITPSTFAVLLGLNGAGKSTLFSLITRLCHPARSYPGFRPRRRTGVERGFAYGRRRVPTTHPRPRSLRDPESDLPCSLARHRQAGRPRAQR